MIKNKFLVTLFLCIYSATVNGQDIVFPKLQGFKILTRYPVYVPETLWDFINGAAEGYLSLGFVDLHVAEYKKGKDIIKLEIYRHRDHTMAFGIYAAERTSSYNFINLGSQGYSTDGAINFFKGSYYVKIRTYSEKPKILQATESLASIVEMMLAGETDMPSLLSLFPDEGKRKNEETYINESVLGHSYLNKAFKALYQVGSDVFGIYLIKSGSSQETTETAVTFLNSAGVEASPAESGKYAFNDGYNGNIFLAWEGDLLVIISDLARDQGDIADKYTSEILK
ncbi:MAG: hypothetical protein JXN62_10305 [Bacteroidales bacterium]|nr:hypothetical protein [Bacteroidales bacterium]